MELEELKQSLEELAKELEKLPEEVVKQLASPPPAQRLAALAKRVVDQSSDQLAKQLREQMFWVYTVIITFCLRQVMVDILPRVLPVWFVDPPQAVAPGSDIWWLESLRLIMYLLMITRFFLGSVVFFKIPPREYKHDVFIGYVHFLAFFAWSLTLKSHDAGWLGLSAYLLSLAIVLLFSLTYWFSKSWGLSKQIKIWAYRNSLTVVLSIGLALIFNHFRARELYVELPALVVVLYFTLADFREMFKNKDPKLLPWLFFRSGGST